MINAMYSVIQVMAAGEVQDYNIERKPWHALTYLVTLLTGVIVFAILVGFVDESVQAMVTLINTGDSKIADEGHTVILGWNESTARVVCQIAFLRRAWLKQNETR